VFSSEMTEAWTAAGTPHECAADLQRLLDAGAQAITLRITGWHQSAQWKRVTNEVLPLIDGQHD
jgi:alkanesulfonate monooxygenase SsuD/methylene tetrahydromethanopterin reductase-like flavin-dependent oxidoreductase (luciferase family)